MVMSSGNVVEIISSIQGEGAHVGCRQIFIRFGGCNRRCQYCDTRNARQTTPVGRAQVHQDFPDFVYFDNPLDAAQVVGYAQRLQSPSLLHHAVSLTGGEPLLQAEFLQAVAPGLRQLGLRIYLETNGTLPAELSQVIELVDGVAMDIKLESATGEATPWEESSAFLRLARGRKVFVKLVVVARTPADELKRAAEIVADVDAAIPVFLQPITLGRAGIQPPSPQQLLEAQSGLSAALEDVRVLPQVHKLIGMW